LSGGMKQKLGLCCALIHRPPLLLLDEPTFGVDPISRRDLWLIVHDMVHAGTTVIASTAYLDEAERCDRVMLLHQGQELGRDTPAAVHAGAATLAAAFITRSNKHGRPRRRERAPPPVWEFYRRGPGLVCRAAGRDLRVSGA